jgi:hypothetical protein
MKRELEFVGSFTTSILLLAGSFAVAQIATTAKKANGTTLPAAASTNQSGLVPQTQAGAVTNDSAAQRASPQPQSSVTTTKPKTTVSADKRTIPVPQL